MTRGRMPYWLVAAGLLTAGWAAAALVDQSQPLVDGSAPAFVVGGATAQVLAQTLTAGVTGRLAAVQLPVGCLSGTLTLQVQEVSGGVPSGTVVASHSLPAQSLPAGPPVVGFLTVTIPGTPFFVAGERFALVLRSSGTCEVAAGPLGDSYLGGQGFFRDGTHEPSVWRTLVPRSDLPFQTLVDAEGQLPAFPEEGTTGFVYLRCFLSALGP